MAPRPVHTVEAAHARRPPEGAVRLEQLATVAAVWRVTELDRLRAIEGEHGLSWGAVESRFHYKGRPEVRVVAVRVARLPAPAALPEVRRYTGCVSWVELDEDVRVAGALPTLPDDAFARRLEQLTAALGPPLGDQG